MLGFVIIGETLYPSEFCAKYDMIGSVWVYSAMLDGARTS